MDSYLYITLMVQLVQYKYPVCVTSHHCLAYKMLYQLFKSVYWKVAIYVHNTVKVHKYCVVNL